MAFHLFGGCAPEEWVWSSQQEGCFTQILSAGVFDSLRSISPA